jgi:hypothetical protein
VRDTPVLCSELFKKEKRFFYQDRLGTNIGNGVFCAGIPSVSGGPLDQCLQVSEKDNVTVMLGLCQGSQREVWSVKGSAIESALGGCIDDAPNPAVNASTVGMWVGNVYDAGEEDGTSFIRELLCCDTI